MLHICRADDARWRQGRGRCQYGADQPLSCQQPGITLPVQPHWSRCVCRKAWQIGKIGMQCFQERLLESPQAIEGESRVRLRVEPALFRLIREPRQKIGEIASISTPTTGAPVSSTACPFLWVRLYGGRGCDSNCLRARLLRQSARCSSCGACCRRVRSLSSS